MDTMQNILIAIHHKELAIAISQAITNAAPGYRIHTCRTGAEALELIEALRPDALIIGFPLMIIDGLSVLAASPYRPPVIIGLTNFISPQIACQAHKLGVQHISLIPCKAKSIATHLSNMLHIKEPSLGM